MQPESVRLDRSAWGRLGPGGTVADCGGRLTSSADVRFSRMESVPIRSPVRARAADVAGLRFDTPTGYVSLMEGTPRTAKRLGPRTVFRASCRGARPATQAGLPGRGLDVRGEEGAELGEGRLDLSARGRRPQALPSPHRAPSHVRSDAARRSAPSTLWATTGRAPSEVSLSRAQVHAPWSGQGCGRVSAASSGRRAGRSSPGP